MALNHSSGGGGALLLICGASLWHLDEAGYNFSRVLVSGKVANELLIMG